jgi:two-component system, cell cycle sensor histidine kinase and response regulator CckA
MSQALRVLIVEDSVDDTFFIVRELQRGGFEVEFERVETAASMQAALAVNTWDLIVSDYRLPQFSGSAALAVFQRTGLDIPFIVVSGALSEEAAVEMLKSGAHDYVMKDRLMRLTPSVTRELRAAEERHTRRQMESSAAFLASLVQSCDDAITGKTLDGTVVSWNKGAEQLYGYTAKEMIGRSISVLIPRYRPQELPEILEKIARGDHVQGLETVRVRKDGQPIEVSLTISPIKDPGGRIVGASTVARDITLRKQEENERLSLIQDLTAALAHVNTLTSHAPA